MSFEKYGLSSKLLDGLADIRLNEPTPLQEKMIPALLDGKHILVEMQTNDDLAFLIPALQKITENGEVSGTQVLILTPSVERAEIIDEQVWMLGYHAQISSALMSMKGDKIAHEQALLKGVPVIVANPSRYVEILDKNNFMLRDLKLIVIDEAHEMEQYNLINKVKDILRFVNCAPQIAILSSDNNSATKKLVHLALKNPELIGFESNADEEMSQNSQTEVVHKAPVEIDFDHVETKLKKATISVVLKKDIAESTNNKSVNNKVNYKSYSTATIFGIDQGYIRVPPRMKISTLMAYLEHSTAKRIVVFSASSKTSDRLFKIIRKKKWGVVSLGDDLSDAILSERMERFQTYNMRVLLMGGIQANKIDFSSMEEIINYDLPSDIEEYTSRTKLISNGSVHKMISLVSKMDIGVIENLSNELGYTPVELPFPVEVKKKKKTSSDEKKPEKNVRKRPKLKANKSIDNNILNKYKKKETTHSLPRPTYDGLSGGREGKTEAGLFDWVKKIFK